MYAPFIIKHFHDSGRDISTEAINYLYQRFEGTTWYIQKICNEVYASSDPGMTVNVDEIDIAIKLAVEEKDDIYQDIMNRLTAKQKALLIALAREGKDVQPTSGLFVKKYNLSSVSAVQRGLSSLLDKDLITSENGKYFVYDYFLNEWIKSM